MHGLSESVRRALAAVEIAVQVDEDRLARAHVAHQLEAERIERHAFGSHQILIAPLGLAATEYERPDAVGIPEGEQPVARDHGDHRIGAATAAMHARYGREYRRGIELVVGDAFLQLVREHVQQNFRIGVRVDVTQILPEKIVLQLLGIREISVVPEHDAERRIHVKRLRLRGRPRRARRRVTRVRNAGVTGERAHIARAENVAHHAAAFVHVKGRAVGRHDAGRVLAAMLQHQEPVVQHLVHRAASHYTQYSAHRCLSRKRCIGTSRAATMA